MSKMCVRGVGWEEEEEEEGEGEGRRRKRRLVNRILELNVWVKAQCPPVV